MKKATRLLTVFLTMVLTVMFLPFSAFAIGGDTVSLTGNYYEVDENGAISGEAVANPEKMITDTVSDVYINMNKTAATTSNDNEFEITLNVETMEKQYALETTEPVHVVLVFDVSDSMDNTANDKVPGDPGWRVEDTRWTALKNTAKDFIEKLFQTSTYNQVSIVVYGGSVFDSSTTSSTVHATICDWTSDADSAISSFYYYEVVSPFASVWLELSDNDSLRGDVFGADGFLNGSTNAQAGFRGAIEELGNDTSDNDEYVIYMSDGLASSFSSVLSNTTNVAVDMYFHSNDAAGLAAAYEEMFSNVVTASVALMVTDPMPDYVTLSPEAIAALESETNNSVMYDRASKTFEWDIANSAPTETTEGSNTVYKYSLSYIVAVAPTDLLEGEIYPLNKQTTLTYAFTGTGAQELGEVQTANFLVPTVTLTEPTPVVTYKVTYDANGGTGAYADTDLASGSSYCVCTQATTSIQWDAYTFLGWSTKANGSGTDYAPGDTITITEDVTLYAQWEIADDELLDPDDIDFYDDSTYPGNGAGANTKSNLPTAGDTNNIVPWVVLGIALASLGCLWGILRKRHYECLSSATSDSQR